MGILKRGNGVLAAVAIALAGSVFAAAPALARTNHALLVAVTKYPNLKGADLVGPNNDIRLVRTFLEEDSPAKFEPAHIRVLADGLDGALESPTHDAITGQLTKLAETVAPGDFVYLHFSGHGTQQPAVDVTQEPDGLDEVFLPADTNRWVDRSKGIPSAFADNEIGDAVQAIRDKGAFVWIVIDACHSGTATRAAPVGEDDVTERKVEPSVLGIPDEAFAEAEAEAKAAAPQTATRGVDGEPEASRALALYAEETEATGAETAAEGGLVAFFAAQTVETTPEMLLPRGSDDAQKLGLFTYTLFSKIAENPNVSYRQLSQSIIQAYAAENRTRPTPLFEGRLDAPVFGTTGGDFVKQWEIRKNPAGTEVEAGALHGLAPGAILAVLENANDNLEDAKGYLEVVSTSTLTSRVRPVEYEGKPAMDVAAIPENGYARVAFMVFDHDLRVARPNMQWATEEQVAEINAILDRIANDEKTPIKMTLVDPGESADVKLALLSENDAAVLVSDGKVVDDRAAMSTKPRLWFLPPTAEIALTPGRRPPSIGIEGSTAEGLEKEVGETLVKIFRATNLSRLAAASDFKIPSGFEVSFKIARANRIGSPEANGATEPMDAPCQDYTLAAPENRVPMQAGDLPESYSCDVVYVQAENRSGKPLDMNVLYVGSDYSIGHMYVERLQADAVVDTPILRFTDDSYGVERMIVVLTEGKGAMEDLAFMEQEAVRTMTRSLTHPEGFAGLLRDIGSAPATRGGAKYGASSQGGGGPKGTVLIYEVETKSRS